MKKKICVILTLILSFTLFLMPVAASESVEVSPASLQKSTCDLTISGMTATASCDVRAVASDSITITLYIQKYKDGVWDSVKSQTQTTTSDKLSFSMSKLITAGQFRAKAVVVVKDGGKSETHTAYSATKVKN